MEVLEHLFLKIALMVLFGAFLTKKKILTDEMQDGLSDLLLRAILPVSILGSSQMAYKAEVMQGLGLSAAVSSVYYVAALLISFAIVRGVRIKGDKANIFVTMNMFANVGFIGMPLAEAIYGKEGLLYAVIYNLVYQVFLVIIGIPLLGERQKKSWKSSVKDPLIWLSFVAIILFVSPVRFPSVFQETCDAIGNMMVPISMMIIGSDLAKGDLKSIFNDKLSYLVCAMRLLIYPLLMLAVLRMTEMPQTVSLSLILLTALPCGSLNVILAKKYHCEEEFASRTVILSMVFMVITVPLVIYVTGI